MTTRTKRKIVLITGSNSGFGSLIALNLAKSNYIVYATMRNVSNAEQLKTTAKQLSISDNHLLIHKLDVSKTEDIEAVKKQILKKHGRLDILINNAGFSQGGVIEDISMDKWEHQFQTNFFGVVAMTKAFIPMMRQARSGKIIQMGSISGRIGLPGLAPYAASKFALEGFTESLRFELKPFQVYSSIIEAGSFRTDIWQKGFEAAVQSDIIDYESLMTFMNKYAQQQMQTSENPQKVVNLVRYICDHKQPKFRYQIGKGIKVGIALKSLLPWSIVERVLFKKLNNK
ncbi:SDR family oxidoreductase [Salipaludibacillus daqingensis]|uniref:SDR family oxidoreductase n=1 Tax=Salipaludibacillus daqingensis TaxID=3041001 RepID=UPI002476FAFC|nr:SDR family oxidoreductase [Salipaludibacillus daqingensis]